MSKVSADRCTSRDVSARHVIWHIGNDPHPPSTVENALSISDQVLPIDNHALVEQVGVDFRWMWFASCVLICVVGIILTFLFCPWPICPCVTVTRGTCISSSIKHLGDKYYVEYQYYLSVYNTSNCFRTDRSRRYPTTQLAEQYAQYSDYVNFTEFYYDRRIQSCYDTQEGRLDKIAACMISVVVGTGITICILWCSLRRGCGSLPLAISV